MADLATLDDVALALGLANSSAMSTSEKTRAEVLLPQVSYQFAREAQRDFIPGESSVRLRVLDSGVTLSEVPSVTEETPLTLTDPDDREITSFTVKGREVTVNSWPSGRPDFVYVTYTHSTPVPDAVVSSVAAIVARYVRIDPHINPAIGISTELAAGDFRQRFADWTAKSVALSEEDIKTARSFRRPSPAMVMGT